MSNVSFASGSILGLSVTDSSPFVYSGTLSNTNGGANALGLLKLGGGTLVLNQATLSGPTTILAVRSRPAPRPCKTAASRSTPMAAWSLTAARERIASPAWPARAIWR